MPQQMALWTKTNQTDCYTIELIFLSISTREELRNQLAIEVLKSRDLSLILIFQERCMFPGSALSSLRTMG